MRHLNDYRKLNRTSSHRMALLRNLAISLIKYEKIQTGLFKSKELQSYIDRLVTYAKKSDSSHAHRLVFARLQDKLATKKLVTEIASRYSNRKGGYTSIHRTFTRRGDACKMACIEFVVDK